MSRFTLTGGARRAAFQVAALLGATLVPAVAHAHFFLDSPENWTEQDAQGDPQKTGPCGSEGNPMGNGVVTPYMAGETIMVQFHETVAHPGHFRVALGVDGEASLPATPTTTAMCGSAVIQDPPVFPILADGEFVHTAKLNGVQTIEVTLPSDVSCTNCVLQVIQFMSGGNMGCFYHHCANISITGGMSGSGGMSSGGAPSAGAGGTGGQGMGGMSVASGGMSGTVGQGGVAPTSGGASGTGGGLSVGGSSGTGTGGSSGTASASGGMATLPVGGRAASAGGSAGTGGSTGGTAATTGGTAPVTPVEAPAEEGGCSLSTASPKPGTTMLGIASLLALGLALARRRRR